MNEPKIFAVSSSVRRSNLPRFRARSSRGGGDDDAVDAGASPAGIIADLDDDDENDRPPLDAKTVKEMEHLAKMRDSGAAQAMLQEMERRRKTETLVPVDPRSASRTPSATHEPGFGTRYESPIFACQYLRCPLCYPLPTPVDRDAPPAPPPPPTSPATGLATSRPSSPVSTPPLIRPPSHFNSMIPAPPLTPVCFTPTCISPYPPPPDVPPSVFHHLLDIV